MIAEKEKMTRLLKTARGQLDGIAKMMDDDRYCMDIYNQLLATQSILKKINKEILRAHMEHCVKASFASGEGDDKIAEILAILDKS